MNATTIAIWLGVGLGCAIGVAGGLLGTYCSVRNTHSDRERRFVIKASIACWALVLAFVLLMMVVPQPYTIFITVVYALVLSLGIMFWNRRQAQIRQESHE